jgi:hypothetical protein
LRQGGHLYSNVKQRIPSNTIPHSRGAIRPSFASISPK